MPESSTDRQAVAGSHRTPLPGAHREDPVAPDEQAAVTVLLRRPAPPPAPSTRIASRADFVARLGASEQDVDAVTAFADTHGLHVTAVDRAARTIKLAGTLRQLQQAFGVTLYTYAHPDGSYRGREGDITVPAALGPVVAGVFGLDDRPQLRPHLQIGSIEPDHAVDAAHSTTFWATEVGALYEFPSDVTGAGECIGILEFGGGVPGSDLDSYFQTLHLNAPTVVSVSVDGAQADPGTFSDQHDADGEVALDVEVAGAIAPGARIAVYYAPNTDRGFVDAITQAVHDRVNQPSVLSISWGAPENLWSEQTRQAIDEAFVDAAALGVTVFAAAGDHGSADQPPMVDSAKGDQIANPDYDGRAHVDFPASSPHAIGCGGTRLSASGGTITGEKVWNAGDGWATGGGVSDVFDVPDWQQDAGVPVSLNPGGRVGRGVPDIAGNADSATGYRVRLYGHTFVIGGTSAVAPLWAGLTALLNQAAGKPLGLITPQLYANAANGLFHDVTVGDNGIPAVGSQAATPGYPAARSWDACTGWGSPNGAALRTLFTSSAT